VKDEGGPNFDNYSSVYPLAHVKLLQLQVMIPGKYFTVDQVIEILTFFPIEDYFRVQVLTSFFGRIVDINNLNKILDEILNYDERVEAYYRLGILNVLDPVIPERSYRLDLRRRDHREVAKILVKLAAVEPGQSYFLYISCLKHFV